jgi:hypothetical protein
MVERQRAQDGVFGPQPTLNVLCKFADVAAEPHPRAWFEGEFSAQFPGLDHYWQELSYGQISLAPVNVMGWYTLPRPWGAYVYGGADTDLYLLEEECLGRLPAAVDIDDYVMVNMMFNKDLGCCAWGGARDGTRLRTAPFRGHGRHLYQRLGRDELAGVWLRGGVGAVWLSGAAYHFLSQGEAGLDSGRAHLHGRAGQQPHGRGRTTGAAEA